MPKQIEDKSGVYFFSRKFGTSLLPFYIGETIKLKQRLKSHLGTKKVADVLRGISEGDVKIKQGERSFHYGYFRAKPGQPAKTCIRIVQRYLIREALASNIPLLNTNLTSFKVDKISFSGTSRARAIYKKSANVEAS